MTRPHADVAREMFGEAGGLALLMFDDVGAGIVGDDYVSARLTRADLRALIARDDVGDGAVARAKRISD